MVLRTIDVESTGTDPTKDAVIEIASVDLVRHDDTFTVVNQMQTFVNPGRPIPPVSMAVHHIIDQDVADAPPLREAIGQFEGADWNVAHNAPFEMGFLPMLGADWICTYRCALRVWPHFPSHGNQALRYQLGLVNPFGMDRNALVAHRAFSDAVVTAAVLAEMLKTGVKWSDLVAWSKEPPLLQVMGFGKHKGTKWSDVPADYLEWIIGPKCDLDADTKWNAKHWLAERVKVSA